jgi:alkylation response protein AidB-like acyl-CoA dehydrogenase
MGGNVQQSNVSTQTVDRAGIVALVGDLVRSHPPASTPLADFLGARFDAGLAWVDQPVGQGGLDAPAELQAVVEDLLEQAGAPKPSVKNPIGVGMAAPTLMVFGSPAQRARLRSLFTGDEIWCQLFSEPGAGSDVAGVSTRAVRDGDSWVVNGQKVWTSLGHLARWGLLLVRTDPTVPKHKGLSYFVLDMQAPGVEVRPLRQITGEAEFNEIYLTDVRIADEERLGDVGAGWSVALTTLMNERVSIGGMIPPRGAGIIGVAVDTVATAGRNDPAEQEELLKLWVESEVLRLMGARSAAMREKGTPGPEGSVAKLKTMDLRKRIAEFSFDALGEDSLAYGTYDLLGAEHVTDADVGRMYLRTRAHSIEGGTTEVMKNILAERVLGLPGEIRVDKDVAFSEVPK